MKKIGILTFHRSINYGAFMQSFSLAQQLTKRYGNVVEVIDFEKASKHRLYHQKHNLIRSLVFGNASSVMRSRFNEDLKLLPLSEKTLITDDYSEVLNYINGRYDIIIVGSDAVWAYNRGLGLKNPYWLFGSQLDCEKYSYAASAFSLDKSTLSYEDIEYIKSCLQSFSYIGVRDQETENLVKMCFPDANVHRNCDPTVLLDEPSIDQSNMIFNRLNLNPNKKLVSIMMGEYDPIIYRVIGKLGRKDYQYVFLYKRMKALERFNPFSPRYLYNLSPYEWYLLFGRTFLCLTTYFHGSLLALKSNVPVISFDTCRFQDNYISKIRQVFGDMELDRYYNSFYNGINDDSVLSQVEYIVSNHDEIEHNIKARMHIEAAKAESFFNALDNSMK